MTDTAGPSAAPTAPGPFRSPRDAWLLFLGALVLRLAALQPGLPPTPSEAHFFGSDPGGLLFTVRLAFVVAGSLAVILLAWAGAQLGGSMAGWAAGLLLTLTPFALEQSSWAGPPGLFVAAGSGAFLHLCRGAGRSRPRELVAALAYALVGAAGFAATGWENAADPAAVSPLLEGFRQTARVAGPVSFALALAGVAVTWRIGRREGRVVLGATGALFLVALLREGPDPHTLGVVLPGTLLLASMAIARPEVLFARAPANAGRIALGVALLAGLVGSTRAVASRWVATPQEEAAEWLYRHLPFGAAVLVEDPEVRLPTLDRSTGEKGFQPVELPGRGSRGLETALFYDPALAGRFPWIVLRDLPRRDPTDDEAARARREFHDLFTGEWTIAARFGSGWTRAPGVTVLTRPEDRKLEPAPAGTTTGDDELAAVRDSSRALTRWMLRSAEALREGGELAGARAFLDLARERDPGNAEVHFELGLLHLLAERFDDAKAALLAALEIDPEHGAAHYNLATVLEREEEPAGAETEYRAAILHLEDPTPAHARLGVMLAERGEIEAALEELRELRRLDPGGVGELLVMNALEEAAPAP